MKEQKKAKTFIYIFKSTCYHPPRGGSGRVENNLHYSKTIAHRGNKERGKVEIFIHSDLHVSSGTYTSP